MSPEQSEKTEKKKTIYGIKEGLAELEEESDGFLDSDGGGSYDSAEEDAFLHGEDLDLDKNYSGSDEEWEPQTKKQRCSNTPPFRSPAPTGPRPITPSPSPRHPNSTPTKTKTSPRIQLPLRSTPTLARRRSAVAERKARGRSCSTSDISLSSQTTPIKQAFRSSHFLGQVEENMWHDITDDDEAPSLPKFLPKRPPGPQLVSTMSYSPLQLFQLFFSTSTVQTLVNNTNKFAEISAAAGKKLKWTPLSVREMYAYISLIIYMGLVKAKTLADYWSQKQTYTLAYPCSVMSSKRFFAISSSLHLCDPEEDAENLKKKGTLEYDKLFKIKPLYTDILSACHTFFHPKRELSIDERMVPSKARNGLKQYMKAKPVKWGFKLFILADSATGYTWNYFVYEGKSTITSGKGLSYDTVKTLLNHSLLGSGYKVYMDNFYTSPGLFSELLQENTLACGTIRTSRPSFSRKQKAARGTIRWYREGKLLFVKWMDTREVNMCSTMHKAYTGDTVNRRVKNEQGVWTTMAVPIPAAVKDYNKYMGGVDLSDALIGYYSVLHKSKKWYKTFFFHFIDIAIVNSFILYQQMAKKHSQDPLTQKVFREKLLVELANVLHVQSDVTDVTGPPKEAPQEEPPAAPPVQPAQEGKCMPVFYSSDATAGRRKCEQCKREGQQLKTPVYCAKCNVPLCFVPKRNCFKKWHDNL